MNPLFYWQMLSASKNKQRSISKQRVQFVFLLWTDWNPNHYCYRLPKNIRHFSRRVKWICVVWQQWGFLFFVTKYPVTLLGQTQDRAVCSEAGKGHFFGEMSQCSHTGMCETGVLERQTDKQARLLIQCYYKSHFLWFLPLGLTLK